MAQFSIEPLNRFETGQTSIKRPREFTYFSYTHEHELRPQSTESLCYYYPPIFDTPGGQQKPIDLSEGFRSFVKKDDSPDEHLDGLLDTLQAHEEKLLEEAQSGVRDIKDVRTTADIITWRGMMTKILTAPCDHFNEFEMNATFYQGSIWVEEHHDFKTAGNNTVSNLPRNSRGGPSQDMMSYWGYKFEALSVLRRPWAEVSRDEIENRNTDIVNNMAQYCSIVRTGIGQSSLILAGEVDAVLGEKPDDPDLPIPWVELKTTQQFQPNNPKDVLKFERKMLRFWAQSFLLGVPNIVVGYRTQDGHLTQVQQIKTQKIPQQVKNSTRAWDGNLCINFTAAFLAFLKETITTEGVWRIARVKGRPTITVTKIEESGTGEILKPSFKVHRDKLLGLEISAALGKGIGEGNAHRS